MSRRDRIKNKIFALNPYKSYDRNAMGFSVLFADVYKDYLRFNRNACKWFYYNGKVWQCDLRNCETMVCLKEFVEVLWEYAISTADTKYQSTVGKLSTYYHRDNMLKDCSPHYYFDSADADKEPMILNCQNGTLNLETMILQPHNPNDKLTKICNVSFAQDAQCPQFEKFIGEVMQHNKEKINYLQKAIGYSLTGLTNLETCFVLYGATTRNGKSTLVETINYMLGEDKGYALNMSPETLSQKNSGAIRSDLARLHGCRFLNASEPPKRMIFDIGLLKTLLGNDTVTARKLYENEIQFRPIFKLFINTNYLPHINDDTIFSSNRINVITFDQHFYAPDEEGEPKQDHNLKIKLKAELSGILNWCLEGLKKFKAEGLEPPQCVKDATKEYREQSDKLNNFIIDCLIEDKDAKTEAGKIYTEYADWCEKGGYGTENKTNFFAELKVKGLFLKSATMPNGKTSRNIMVGYKLKPLDDKFFVDDMELLKHESKK